MANDMRLVIWDVEHGACAMLTPRTDEKDGALAMIDSGCTETWRPSSYIRNRLGRQRLDYLFITNADQDHMSDLQGLWNEGISVETTFRNPSYTGEELRNIKRKSGPLTQDAQRYALMCEQYNQPVAVPFNAGMGGITATTFWSPYPNFADTNDLSLIILVEYLGFKILFPGDLEKAGWKAILQRADFRDAVRDLNLLVASHHGRESGFYPGLFDCCQPSAVIISDKPIQHETQQMVPDYRQVADGGVYVETTGKRRHVLTTRRDGWIQITASDNGRYTIETEKHG